MADFRSCLTIPNQTLTIVSRTQVVSDTTTLIPITYPGRNETVPHVTCVPTREPVIARRQFNETSTSSSLVLIIPPVEPARPNCTTTTLFSTTFIPPSVVTVPRQIPITIERNETHYSTLFTTTCSSIPPSSIPPSSIPPSSIPPSSVPPSSIPPSSVPPSSVPPSSIPPSSIPPSSIPPSSIPPSSIPPSSIPPSSIPPSSIPPSSIPPSSIPPSSIPPSSVPPSSIPPSSIPPSSIPPSSIPPSSIPPSSIPPSSIPPSSIPPSSIHPSSIPASSIPPSIPPSSPPPITPSSIPLPPSSSVTPAVVPPVSLADPPVSSTVLPTLPSPLPPTLPASPSPSPPTETDPPAPSTPPPTPDTEPSPAPTPLTPSAPPPSPDTEPSPAPTPPLTPSAPSPVTPPDTTPPPPVPVPTPTTTRPVLPLVPTTTRLSVSSDPSGAVPPQLPDPTASAVGQTKDVPVKVIVGSVFGGLAALAVLGFGVYYFFFKKSPVAPTTKYNALGTDEEDQPRLQAPDTGPHWGQYPEMQEYIGAQTGQEIQYVNNVAGQGHYTAVPSSDQLAVQYSDVPGNGNQYMPASDPSGGQGVLQHSDIPGNGPQTFGQDGGQNITASNVQAQGPQVMQGHDGTQLQYNHPHGQEQGHFQSDVQGQVPDTAGQGQTDLHQFHDAGVNDQGPSGYSDVNAQGDPGYTDVNGQGAPPYDAQVQGDPFTLDQSGMHTAPYAPDNYIPGAHPPGLENSGSSMAALVGVAAAGGTVIPATGAAVGFAAGRLDERSTVNRPSGGRVLQKRR